MHTLKTFGKILFLISVFIPSGKHVISQNIYKQLRAIQCDSLIKANETNADFVILDVRTQAEWLSEHIEGSINRSTGDSDFQQRLNLLPKHKIYLLHCKSGGRSAGAFEKMKNLNFAEVYEMIGGINMWKSNRLPTTNVLTPRLMLVSYESFAGNNADTLNITITNRANDLLVFNASNFTDIHNITSDFNLEKQLAGAEDYTFSIFHSPGFNENETVQISFESNGGNLEFAISIKNGVIQNLPAIESFHVLLYPNPAKDRLYIRSSSTNQPDEINLTSLSGQSIIHIDRPENRFVDVSQLKNGIYMVTLKSKGRTTTKKIIINR